MKNFITTIIITILTLTVSYANTTPEVDIISTDEVTVSTTMSDLFKVATFNVENETIEFTTLSEISVIQIFDGKGNLEFQLPVMSNKVQINKNLLEEGQQKLGFVMDGINQVHFTEVTIK